MAHPSGESEFNFPVFSGVRVARTLVLFCVIFCRSLFFLFVLFLLAFILPVLRYTPSDYPIGTFKLFLSDSSIVYYDRGQ